MNTVRLRHASLVVCLVLAAACGGKSNPGDDVDGSMTGDGGMLPDDGPCTANSLRCNVNTVEQCAADGSHWVPGMTCTTFCQDGTCALDGLDVAADMTLEGTVVVKGAVTVHAGATLSSATGDLTITADSISVENGGSISVAATGMTPEGKGADSFCTSNSMSCAAGGGRTVGSSTDAEVLPGGAGGNDAELELTPASGGGALRLISKTTATIAGQLTANGANGQPAITQCVLGGGGGGGGGILVVGDVVTVTGSISAAGGLGGPVTAACGSLVSLPGQVGRVKILFGASHDITAATIVGTQTLGLAPPIPLLSTSHPDPKAIYNDGFLSLDMAWGKAFPSVMGYYTLLDTTKSHPPTAANGTFLAVDKVSFQSSDVMDGDNYVHLVSVDAQSAISTVETVFHVAINTQPPSVSSTSHPSETTFVPNTNPFFAWSYPQGDDQVSGAYYVFDQYGLTVPAITDTRVPATQKQLLKNDVMAGVWVLHVVSADSQGRLTKAAGHYRVNIGADPGEGSVAGAVVDSTQAPQVGATVTINRGLFTTTTAANGQYAFGTVIPAGTWELSVTLGSKSATKTITVTAAAVTTGNVTIN